MSLIEVLVALVIVALAGIAFLAGLTTAFNGVLVSQSSVTKESLAKSQIEYIKSQTYDDDMNHTNPQYALLTDIPTGYTIVVSALRLDPKENGSDNDDGLQQITVTISHVDTMGKVTSLTISDYKVK